jgi:hypothetical protein
VFFHFGQAIVGPVPRRSIEREKVFELVLVPSKAITETRQHNMV